MFQCTIKREFADLVRFPDYDSYTRHGSFSVLGQDALQSFCHGPADLEEPTTCILPVCELFKNDQHSIPVR